MKALVLIATLVTAALSFSAPLRAAATLPAVAASEQTLTGSIDRRRHQCDTPTNPICQKP